ncbi:hypothetical protein ACYZUA_15320 [Pseudomonas sp. LS2P72]
MNRLNFHRQGEARTSHPASSDQPVLVNGLHAFCFGKMAEAMTLPVVSQSLQTILAEQDLREFLAKQTPSFFFLFSIIMV